VERSKHLQIPNWTTLLPLASPPGAYRARTFAETGPEQTVEVGDHQLELTGVSTGFSPEDAVDRRIFRLHGERAVSGETAPLLKPFATAFLAEHTLA
jgi:hypothetical protein